LNVFILSYTHREKQGTIACQKIGGVANKSKTAILCTPVISDRRVASPGGESSDSQQAVPMDLADESRASLAFPSDIDTNHEDALADQQSNPVTVMCDSEIKLHDSALQ
jgi:hypothetical protein